MKDSIQAKTTAASVRPATPGKAGVQGQDAPPEQKWKKRALLALGLLLLLSGIVWLVMRPPNALAKYKEMEAAVNDPSLSPEERGKQWQALREQGKKLNEWDQAKLALEHEEKGNARYREYAAMTPEQKREHLKNAITKQEEWRKTRAQGGNQGRGANGGGAGRGAQGGAAGGQAGAGGQPGAGGPGGPGGGRRGGGGPPNGQAVDANGQPTAPQPSARDLEDRHDRAKTRLDFSTPDSRGLRDEYRSDMSAMRKAMGLPDRGSGGGGFGGPGGGGPRGGFGGPGMGGPRGPRG